MKIEEVIKDSYTNLKDDMNSKQPSRIVPYAIIGAIVVIGIALLKIRVWKPKKVNYKPRRTRYSRRRRSYRK